MELPGSLLTVSVIATSFFYCSGEIGQLPFCLSFSPSGITEADKLSAIRHCNISNLPFDTFLLSSSMVSPPRCVVATESKRVHIPELGRRLWVFTYVSLGEVPHNSRVSV